MNAQLKSSFYKFLEWPGGGRGAKASLAPKFQLGEGGET